MKTLKDLFQRADYFAGKPILTINGRSWSCHGKRIIYGGKNSVKKRVKQSVRDRNK